MLLHYKNLIWSLFTKPQETIATEVLHVVLVFVINSGV